LALDIGTEAVKALVFEKSGEQYFILSSALQYFDELRPFDNDKIILETAKEAMSRAGKTPKEALMGLPPNMLKSRVKTIEFKRQKPQEVISTKEAESIIESLIREIQKEIADSLARDSGIMPQDIQFSGSEILEIRIDGYEVPGLSGYSGKKVWLKVLSSFLPNGYAKKYGKFLNHLGLKSKIVNPAANLAALRPDDAVFIDIGGDTTQVCLTRGGKIAAIDEFEAGGRDFSMVISQTLGITLREARFLKERYSAGELSDDSRERIKDILSQIFTKWRSLLESKIKASNGYLPSLVLFSGGGSRLLGIKELVGEEREAQLVHPKDLQNIIDNTNCVNNQQFITSILIFYGR